MGLQLTEILMRVEDRFGIRIDDSGGFERIGTVGGLYQCILEKLQVASTANCRTLQQFFVIRRALKDISVGTKRRVSLNTSMHDLIPWKARRRVWKSLRCEMRWLPRLELESRVGKTLLGVAVVGALSVVTGLAVRDTMAGHTSLALPIQFVFMTGYIALALCVPLYFVTRPFARTVPAHGRTPRFMLLHFYPRLAIRNKPPIRSLADDEVWRALVDIIATSLSRPVDSIRPEHRFVEDLDAG